MKIPVNMSGPTVGVGRREFLTTSGAVVGAAFVQAAQASATRAAIFLPGIMGSVLSSPTDRVWSRDAYTNYRTLIDNPNRLFFPTAPLEATAVLDRTTVVGIPIRAYYTKSCCRTIDRSDRAEA